MSDTTQAAVQKARAAVPEVGTICDRVAELVDAGEVQLAARFAELFLARASEDFVRARDDEACARLITGAFRFLQEGSPERVDVQVLNPDEDQEGWYAPVTVIRTNVSERPFIVDTLREFLHSQSWAIENYVYPVLAVARTPEGRIYDIRPSAEGDDRESIVHCEIGRVADQETLDFIEAEVRRRLEDVVRATDDFPAMLEQVNRTAESLNEHVRDVPERAHELKEIQSFLRWLRDGAFVFLGYREYDLRESSEGDPVIEVVSGSGLGVLRDDSKSSFKEPVTVASLPESVRRQVEGGPLLLISKTNAESTVHRRARMDYIGVKKLDRDGNVAGEQRFIGLFTSKAFSEDAERIPILRTKLEAILEEAGVREGSHDYKEIITIFNTMPKEELFLTSADVVGEEIRTVLSTYHTHEVRVTLRDDPLLRGAALMVILPRERFSADARLRIEEALVQRLDGQILNYHLALGTGDQARLHFNVAASPESIRQTGLTEDLARTVRDLVRSWSDQVGEGLEKVRPPQEAQRLARAYGKALSREYQAATRPDDAVRDILQLEAMAAEGRAESVIVWNPESPEDFRGAPVSNLSLYLRGPKLVLSEFMPILENAGLRVIEMDAAELAGEHSGDAMIYVFQVQSPDGGLVNVERCGTLLSDAILAIRAGDATNDSLNSLVIQAELAWRQVDVLRAYATYAFQLGAVPSRQAIPAALRKYPEVGRLLLERFRAAFDPDRTPDREERLRAVHALRREFVDALGAVESLVDDRALRHLSTLIDATVRTNYYRHGGRVGTGRSGGVPFLSFKFDCSKMRELARHRLMVEVWVRSSRMEGVHLRGASVARGGIRWSDRWDDFRTEVLDLVETQMVKNAVIVPAGSKGGFVTLRELPDREAQAEEAKEQYKTLVRGLLDLTDNLVEGEPESPEGVFCYDDPDPYLVVAADKGTAKFSDVANSVAAEYGFWLGDAFASGGSHGYDHKIVGITARGGWECVRRHFREAGKDIQTEPFTVVGIGDMSGDVFGNAMLLSQQTKLIAAFDHRHVFIDPDPDIERSFVERERMFALGRSSWDDYDRDTLSVGGMIVPRGSKDVQLTPEAIAALGLADDTGPMDGESLIRAVLRAPAELLWNGGIGTYVKASHETHAAVGDPTNDRVRVDAPELRSEVIGEGGNLGFTQEARIEFALAGGRINTDALDNSGGVDLSDREVNLKILLDPIVRSGRMSPEERNEILEQLTDEVATFVLADNFSQSRAVSLDVLRVKESVDDFRELMVGLEREKLLDRSAEGLPTWEALSDRLDKGKTLTRPELAVLLSYAKIFAIRETLASSLPDDEATEPYVLDYFPSKAVKEAGRDGVRTHRLRREIVASQLTNDLVDLMGSTFVYRVSSDTGHRPSDAMRAWLVSARLADHEAVVREVNSRRELPTRVAYRWLLGLSRVLERTTRWALDHLDPDESVAEVVRRYKDPLLRLRKDFPNIVSGRDRELFDTRVEEIVRHGADEDFALSMVTLRFLDHLLDVLVIAGETEADPLDAARAYYRVSEVLHVPWIRSEVFRVAGEGRWDQRAAQALSGDLGRAHHALTVGILADAENGDFLRAAHDFTTREEHSLGRLGRLVEQIQTDGEESLSALSVAVREVTVLASRRNGS